MIKRRNELAEKEAAQWTSETFNWLVYDSFKLGFDAGVVEMHARLSELKEDIRLDRVKPDDYRELIEQNKELKAQVEIAVKVLEKYKDAAFQVEGRIYAVGAKAKEALEQIQKMRGG